jgi:eukaryotic-like serine/threonine-protein kinase
MTTVSTQSSGRFASFSIGDWLVQPSTCRLSRDDRATKLRPQLMDVLVCLARRGGQVVRRDEILAEVWPGLNIADSGLSRCIAELRQVLEDDAQNPRIIETVAKRGYRLMVPVEWPPTPEVEQAPALATGRPGATPDVVATGPVEPPRRPRPGRRALVLAGMSVVLLLGVAAALVWMMRPRTVALTERDTVLLADVTNATRDPVFDNALRLALAVNLEQAPTLRILPQEAVRAALLRAGRSPEERVIGPLALDVCRREDGAVLVAGSITSLGSRYLVGLEAIGCRSGERLGSAMAEAASKERVLTALEQAATAVRRRLGESHDSLRQYGVPLVRATTTSLDALKSVTVGDVSRDRGNFAEALTHYRQATEIDPDFALAWARRGVAARNIDLRDEAIPAFRRAFELEGRVSQPERFYIKGTYERFVAGDPNKAIETYRAWKRVYPGSSIAPNALASILCDELGQYEAAVDEAREAVRLTPDASAPYTNLVQAYVGAGRLAEARTAIAEARKRGFDDLSMHAYAHVIAVLERDQATIERESGWWTRSAATEITRLRIDATMAVSGGRIAEARRLWTEAADKASQDQDARSAAEVRLEQAVAEALVGDPRAARTLVEAALSADKQPVSAVRAAIVLSLTGDASRARALLQDAVRRASTDPAPLRVWLPTAEALLATRQGRPEDSLRILQPIAAFEKGFDFALVPLAVRAAALASTNHPAEAAAVYADVLNLQAVVGFSPWDPIARLGLARALRDAGDVPRSLAAYDAFLAHWKDADSGLPLPAVARRERAAVAARSSPAQ